MSTESDKLSKSVARVRNRDRFTAAMKAVFKLEHSALRFSNSVFGSSTPLEIKQQHRLELIQAAIEMSGLIIDDDFLSQIAAQAKK